MRTIEEMREDVEIIRKGLATKEPEAPWNRLTQDLTDVLASLAAVEIKAELLERQVGTITEGITGELQERLLALEAKVDEILRDIIKRK